MNEGSYMIRVIMTNEKGLVSELKASGDNETLLEIGKILFKDCPGNNAVSKTH